MPSHLNHGNVAEQQLFHLRSANKLLEKLFSVNNVRLSTGEFTSREEDAHSKSRDACIIQPTTVVTVCPLNYVTI